MNNEIILNTGTVLAGASGSSTVRRNYEPEFISVMNEYNIYVSQHDIILFV